MKSVIPCDSCDGVLEAVPGRGLVCTNRCDGDSAQIVCEDRHFHSGATTGSAASAGGDRATGRCPAALAALRLCSDARELQRLSGLLGGRGVMTVAQQLQSALRLTVNKHGHLPNCGHLQWLNGWGGQTRHECDEQGCRRTGQPCSRPCQQVRAALKLEVA